MRTIALIHDGDCSDCSCQHLSVADDCDLEAEKAAYKKWYRDAYYVQVGKFSGDLPIGYKSFADWLIERGATWADLEEVEG